TNGGEHLFLASRLEQMLQLEADIEVIFYRRLASSGDDDDIRHPGVHHLFDAVLDERLVDKRQHFFWLGLGSGQESSAEAGGREHGFTNLGYHASNPIVDVTTREECRSRTKRAGRRDRP